MVRRVCWLTSAMVVVLVATGLTAQEADSLPGRRRGQSREVLRLVERIEDVAVQDQGPSGPSLGDRLVFTSNLFDEDDRRVGRDGADCVVVRLDPSQPPAEQQIVQCLVSVELEDGQITFQGLAQGLDNVFAINGGTGAYRTARGEAHVTDRVFLQEADITITLIRS